jgi:hypothetical protein
MPLYVRGQRFISGFPASWPFTGLFSSWMPLRKFFLICFWTNISYQVAMASLPMIFDMSAKTAQE